MSFKLAEPDIVMQTGGLDNLINIPMGPGRSFGSNYELEMMRRGSITERLREHILHAGLEMSDNDCYSLRRDNIYQRNPFPDESTVDFNFGNRPIAGLEEPLALTKFHLNNINREVNKDKFIYITYRTIGGKPNVKNRPSVNVGTYRYWYPVRSALCKAILKSTQSSCCRIS